MIELHVGLRPDGTLFMAFEGREVELPRGEEGEALRRVLRRAERESGDDVGHASAPSRFYLMHLSRHIDAPDPEHCQWCRDEPFPEVVRLAPVKRSGQFLPASRAIDGEDLDL